MGAVSETRRAPDYASDIDKYGKFGEEVFLRYMIPICKEKNYSIIDVRDDAEYRKKDIDFLVDKNGNGIEKIEVKADGRGLDTGNIPYEYISHCASGWSVVTECDKVFMVLFRDKIPLVPVKAFWIDMKKWNEWMKKRKQQGRKINYILAEDGIVDILCKIDTLKKENIVLSEVSLNNMTI